MMHVARPLLVAISVVCPALLVSSAVAQTNVVAASAATSSDVVNSGVSYSAAQTNQPVATINNIHWSAPKSSIEFGLMPCTALGTGTGQCSNTALNGQNNTAIAALLSYIAKAGQCVYTPPGVYPYSSPISWTAVYTTPLCLLGTSHDSTTFYYTGAAISGANGNAAFYVNNGRNFAALHLENVGFLSNSNARYAFRAQQVGSSSSMNNVAFGGGAGSTTLSPTAYSVSGSSSPYTMTLTMTNTFTAGEALTISATSGDALYALNGTRVMVIPTGLSGSQIEFQESAITSGSGSTLATATVTGSAFEGEFFNPQGDVRNVSIFPNAFPSFLTGVFSCPGNGFTAGPGLLNGTASAFPSTQFTLTQPTIEYCSAVGLNFSSAQGVTVNGGQISTNHQNIQDSCSPLWACNYAGNIFNGVLSEAGRVPDQITQHSIYNGLTASQTEDVSAQAIFKSSQFGASPGIVASGLFGPNVEDSQFTSASTGFTDNSAAGMHMVRNRDSYGSTVSEQDTFATSQKIASCSTGWVNSRIFLRNAGNSTYYLSYIPQTLNSAGGTLLISGSIYSARLHGVLPGVVNSIIFNAYASSNPMITLTDRVSALTFAESSGGLTVTVSGTTDSSQLSGTLEASYHPGSNCGYNTPPYGLYSNFPLSANGYYVGNTLVIPVGVTGNTGSSTGKVSLVPGAEAFGLATLSSGTVKVSNPAACTPSATCVYKLTRCIANSSRAVGVPSIGMVVSGTSFVINAESSTNTVVTGDLASICWQIN